MKQISSLFPNQAICSHSRTISLINVDGRFYDLLYEQITEYILGWDIKQGHQTSDNIGFSIDVLPLTQMTQHPPTIITLGSKKAFMWSLGSFWCGF